MSLIRSVLLAGKFRTQHQLNGMSPEDQRNTLIVELSNHTNQPVSHFQAMDDSTLAGTGAVLVFLKEAKIRTDQELKTMTVDDLRNTLIIEIDAQTHQGIAKLQGFSNMELVLAGLGQLNHRDLEQPTFLRGVLLAGKFRTQHELNGMANNDQRNTLIVELTSHSNQSDYQSFNDWDLAGIGAVLVFLREARIRTDQELRAMNANDLRNTLIMEMQAQTSLDVNKLQSLTNINLVRLGLGIDPAKLFQPISEPLRPLLTLSGINLILHTIREYDSNDSGAQGASDEVHAARGVAHDSADIYVENGITKITEHPISITNEDLTNDADARFPITVYSFDLSAKNSYPRKLMVTLFVIEEDNSSLAEDFDKLDKEYRGKIQEAVAAKGSELLGKAGTAIGGSVGAFIGKEILGRAWGYVSGLGFDLLFSAISEGLANDLMPPFVFDIEIPVGDFKFPNNSNSSGILNLEYRGADDAHYGIDYEWVLLE